MRSTVLPPRDTPPGPNLARFFRVPVLAQFLAPNMAKSLERAVRLRHALTAVRRGATVRAASQQYGVSASAIQRAKQAGERRAVRQVTNVESTKPTIAPPLRAQLLAAIEAAEATSVRKAAKVHGISASSIQRARKGQIASTGPGRHALLPEITMKTMAAVLQESCRLGIPWTVSQFKSFAIGVATKHGHVTFKASKNWCKRFFKRFPEVKTAKVAVQARNRTSAANPVALATWFQEIVVPLYEARFGKDPSNIDPRCLHNMDETPLHAMNEDGVAIVDSTLRASKVPKRRGGVNREYYTGVVTVSAAGTMTPPLILFKGTTLHDHWIPQDADLEMMGTRFTATPSGTMNSSLFVKWLSHFSDSVPPDIPRPLILFVDNHSSHIGLEGILEARRLRIELVTFPSNTTHVLQPLDVAVFGVLKQLLKKEKAQ